MKYKRITERRGTHFTMHMWTRDGESLKVYKRLTKLENKIEKGELISTVQNAQSEQELTFFAKHDAEVRKQVVQEFMEEFKSRYFFMMTTYMKDPIYQCTEEELDRLVEEVLEK